MPNYAKDSYVVGAPSTTIAIPFPYQLKADVNLVIGGVSLNGANATWADPQTVTVSSMPGGTVVERQRITEGDEMRAVMQPSNYDATTLNKGFIQLLYLAQELSDRINGFTAGSGFLPRDGSSGMLNELPLQGNPAGALSAVPKQYVDALIAGIVVGSDLVKKDGSVAMTGPLTLPGNPAGALQAVPKQYADLRALRDGDTFTGTMGFGNLSNFELKNDGSNNPHMQLDANSYWRYNRATKAYEFFVENSLQLRLGWDFIAFAKKGYLQLFNAFSDTALSEDGDIAVNTAGNLRFRGAGTTKTVAEAGHTHSIGDITNLSTELVAKASVAQTFYTSQRIETAANKDYMLGIKIPFGFKVTQITTRSEAGTCTLTGKINTTALGGTANSVSTAEQSQDHTTSNIGAAGDDIVVTISGNSGCTGLIIGVVFDRTLPA